MTNRADADGAEAQATLYKITFGHCVKPLPVAGHSLPGKRLLTSDLLSPENMIIACVGLGSNLDEPITHINCALKELATMPATHLLAHSGLYHSAPLGPAGQPNYINAVAALNTGLTAHRLLEQLLAIEDRHGRIRGAARWGPRTLDLDLLLYGAEQYADDRLTVPHPHLHQRGFVLYPLHDIAPDMAVPGRGSVRELLKHCPPGDLMPV